MFPYSTYVLLGLCILVVVFSFWVADKTDSPRWSKIARFSVPLQIAGLLAAYLILRPGSSDDLEHFQQQAQSENKTLFMSFHSNYCGACLMAKPALDELEFELSDKMVFARVNVMDEAHKSLAANMKIRAVPSYILVEPSGKVLYRQDGGKPDKEQISFAQTRWERNKALPPKDPAPEN